MRLLFITNFYPPAGRGGFEQWCQEVAEELRRRGHEVLVLTSTHGRAILPEPDPIWVRRELFLEMEFSPLRNALLFFGSRKKREAENLARLQEMIEWLVPDAILIWGMWNFPRSLPAMAERLMPGKVAYYMGDFWPTLPSQFEHYWNSPARSLMTRLLKPLLKSLAQRQLQHEERETLCLDHVLFPSQFMRAEFERNGITPQSTRIIYGAIDTSPYVDQSNNSGRQKDTISLLYVGRLTREKGVHTAVEALGRLAIEQRLGNVKLMIVGDGDPDYVDYLRELVVRKGIASYVTFVPAQPKEALPSIYRNADIFLFTSIWPEPFGRVIVEAMASGLAVIGTPVGGAAEILIDNDNALVVSPDDPVSLAQQCKRLTVSSALRERLGSRGRETAVKFDIQRMAAEVESYMQTLAG